MDTASDFESEDCGFESHRGRPFNFLMRDPTFFWYNMWTDLVVPSRHTHATWEVETKQAQASFLAQ